MAEVMGRTPVLSLSGAVIEYDGATVCKYSPSPALWDRLNEQAAYMAECGHPFVEVLGMAHGRYWMQRYSQIPIANLGLDLVRAKDSLRWLWDFENPRHIPNDWIKAHSARVRELCAINDLPGAIQPLAESFEEVLDVRNCLTVCGATHGDATLSNVVQDSTGHIRWIDPIPPSLWLRAFKAVDLGKLLQSANGWEHFLMGLQPPPSQNNAVLEGESPADITAAYYFHTLCYLRILRYANGKPSVYEYATNKLYDAIAI